MGGEEVDMGNIRHCIKEFYYEGSREIEPLLEGGWRNCQKKFNYDIFNDLVICQGKGSNIKGENDACGRERGKLQERWNMKQSKAIHC